MFERRGTKLLDSFTEGRQHTQKVKTEFSHEVLLLEKNRRTRSEDKSNQKNTWYGKFIYKTKKSVSDEVSSPVEQENQFTETEEVQAARKTASLKLAEREMAIQEFLRVLIPNAPKYRIGIVGDEPDGGVYVLAKGIKGNSAFEQSKIDGAKKFAENCASGHYTGLGTNTAAALLIGNIDFKLPNQIINAQKALLPIDGDWAIAELRSPSFADLYVIQPGSIKALPSCGAFWACNWLNEIMENKYYPDSLLASAEMAANPIIREEINEFFYVLFILPPELVKRVLCYNISNHQDAEELYGCQLARIEALRVDALSDKSFAEFLANKETTNRVLNNFTDHLMSFTLTEKNCLVAEDERVQLEKELAKNSQQLVCSVKTMSYVARRDYEQNNNNRIIAARQLREELQQMKERVINEAEEKLEFLSVAFDFIKESYQEYESVCADLNTDELAGEMIDIAKDLNKYGDDLKTDINVFEADLVAPKKEDSLEWLAQIEESYKRITAHLIHSIKTLQPTANKVKSRKRSGFFDQEFSEDEKTLALQNIQKQKIYYEMRMRLKVNLNDIFTTGSLKAVSKLIL